MELVTIADRTGGRPGLVVGERIFDLRVGHSSHELSRWRPESVVSILDAGDEGRERLQALYDALIESPDLPDLRSAWLPLAGTQLGPPIRRPGLLMALGVMGDTLLPILKSPGTLAGPDHAVSTPASGDFCVRPLLGIVIGRRCYRMNPREARTAVGGVTLVLEFTRATGVREELFPPGFQSRYLGGQTPGSFLLGPKLLLPEREFDEEIVLTLNGVIVERWQSPTADAIGAAIGRLSQWFGFKAGDLVAFGANPDRPVALAGGESLGVSADSLGTLQTQLS